MGRRKVTSRISGKTADGRDVIAGLFPIVGTHGYPLDLLVEDLRDRGAVLDMPDFIEGAKKDGWKPGTILAKFRETALGQDAEFMRRLQVQLQ